MAYQYSTLVTNAIFDAIKTALQVGGSPVLVISAEDDTELVRIPFSIPLEKSRTNLEMLLNPPEGVLVSADGEAFKAVFLSGSLEEVVSFSVGSPSLNPDAELIITSTVLYAGGMMTLTKIGLKV